MEAFSVWRAGFLVAVCLLLATTFSHRSPLAIDDEPSLRSDPAMGAEPKALSAIPCVAGMADIYPCANVDLLAFMPRSAIGGGNGNDIWGWTDPPTGREYAIMGRTSGTSFVDISDPEKPVYLGDLPTHTVNSTWRGIKVYADHAFIVSEASGHGMQVFDLRQLRSVASPPVTFSETAHYNGFSSAHTIAINEQSGFAYAAGSNTCSGGLHMVNIQDPASPTNAGCFSADGYTHETQCVIYNGPDGTHANREICFNSNEDTLTIVDVTNKLAPVMLSRTSYSESGYTHQGWLTEDHAFFLLDDELDELNLGTNTRTHIWDVSDLDAPQRIGIYEAATLAIDHNLYIRGNLAYQANYRAGLRILDIIDIKLASLREVAFFDIFPSNDNPGFNGAWSTYPFFPSGAVVVGGIEQGLFVLRHNLGGTGQGLPNFTLSVSPQSATVRRGQSANYTVTLTPQNGFSTAVSLSCSGLPSGTSCSFSPNPVTPAGAPANSTLKIATASSSAFLTPHRVQPPIYAIWVPFSLLALIGFGAVQGSREKRGQRFLLLLFLLVLLALPGVGCGGGSSVSESGSSRGQTGTPAGTYTVKISGPSDSIRRSTTVTLVVQQ